MDINSFRDGINKSETISKRSRNFLSIYLRRLQRVKSINNIFNTNLTYSNNYRKSKLSLKSIRKALSKIFKIISL